MGNAKSIANIQQSVVLTQSSSFDIKSADFSSEDYYLWSRIDGKQTLEQVVKSTGLPLSVVEGCLQNLIRVGAVEGPGVAAPPLKARGTVEVGNSKSPQLSDEEQPPTNVLVNPLVLDQDVQVPPVDAAFDPPTQQVMLKSPPGPSSENSSSPSLRRDFPKDPVTLSKGTLGQGAISKEQGKSTFVPDRSARSDTGSFAKDTGSFNSGAFDQVTAMPTMINKTISRELDLAGCADVDLTQDEVEQLLLWDERVKRGDYFEILGVTEQDSVRDIKRTYFKLSKKFHPDRFYKKEVGPFGPMLSRVFDGINKAFSTLGNKKKRADYLRQSGRGPGLKQSKEEHSRDLYNRGCSLQGQGKTEDALKFFVAAHKIHPSPRALRRAVDCYLTMSDVERALQCAQAAVALLPGDPSYLRMLSRVHATAGDIASAQLTLRQALDIPTENDALVSELYKDLKKLDAKNK